MRYAALLSAALLAFGTPAPAAVIFFEGTDSVTDAADPSPNADAAFADFDAATGPLTTIDFEGTAPGGFTTLSSTDLGIPGVSVTPAGASDGDDTLIQDGFDNLFSGFNTTPGGERYLRIAEFDDVGEPAVGVNILFASPISAFGARFTGLSGASTGTVFVSFDNGAPVSRQVTEPATLEGHSFLGLTAMSAFSSVTILLTPEGGFVNETFGVDDVVFGQSLSLVPLPAPVLLLLGGIAGLAAVRARRGSQRGSQRGSRLPER